MAQDAFSSVHIFTVHLDCHHEFPSCDNNGKTYFLHTVFIVHMPRCSLQKKMGFFHLIFFKIEGLRVMSNESRLYRNICVLYNIKCPLFNVGK